MNMFTRFASLMVLFLGVPSCIILSPSPSNEATFAKVSFQRTAWAASLERNIFDQLADFKSFTCDQAKEALEHKTLPQGATQSQINTARLLEGMVYVQNCAYRPPSPMAMMNALLGGIVQATNDPHSSYFPEQNTQEYRKSTASTTYFGIGLELQAIKERSKFKGAAISGVVPDSPAAEHDILPGDTLLSIQQPDGKFRLLVSYPSLEEVIKEISLGEKGSAVVVRISRDGEEGLREFRLIRGDVNAMPVRVIKRREDGWMIIRLRDFWKEGVASEIERKYRQALSDSEFHKRYCGVMLDLRNNPGGFTVEAFRVIALFAPEVARGKPILYVEDRSGVHEYTGSLWENRVSPKNLLNGKPLVVLVDGGSLSSAEIVAQFLQLYGIPVAGTPTFGKGSSQWNIPLKDGKTMMRLTTEQYLVVGPDGKFHAVQNKGVIPNILLAEGDDKITQDDRVHEKDLPGAISPSNAASVTSVISTKETNPALYEEMVHILTTKPFKFSLPKVIRAENVE